MLNIAWFSSVRDDAAIGLLKVVTEAIKKGIIDGKIPWVFCNEFSKDTIKGLLDIVMEHNIHLFCYPSKGFMPKARRRKRRRLYDKAVLGLLQDTEKPDILVFAGYMRIVSKILCNAFNILNLHPALPGGPKGTWRQTTQYIVDKKLGITGTMIHLVIPKLDAGSAISFCTVNVEGCNFAEVRRRQLEQEFPLLVLTLTGLANGTIKIGDAPVDLTKEVEAFIRENASTI